MMAFVSPLDNGKWEAKYSFWDGVAGSGGKYDGVSIHDTIEGAQNAVERAEDEFPFPLARTNAFVDDIVV